jgi:hypothetical protein
MCRSYHRIFWRDRMRWINWSHDRRWRQTRSHPFPPTRRSLSKKRYLPSSKLHLPSSNPQTLTSEPANSDLRTRNFKLRTRIVSFQTALFSLQTRTFLFEVGSIALQTKNVSFKTRTIAFRTGNFGLGGWQLADRSLCRNGGRSPLTSQVGRPIELRGDDVRGLAL